MGHPEVYRVNPDLPRPQKYRGPASGSPGRDPALDTLLLSNVKSEWNITQNFCGLLRKPEFYENVKMRLHKGFENFVLFWSAKKYVCARRGFRVRAPFPPIDMSKTFFGSFSCLLAGWISLLFFSIHFFSF